MGTMLPFDDVLSNDCIVTHDNQHGVSKVWELLYTGQVDAAYTGSSEAAACAYSATPDIRTQPLEPRDTRSGL